MDASPDGVAMLSRDGRIAFINESGQGAFNSDAVGVSSDASWASLWPETERPKALMALGEALRGGVGRFQAHGQTREGTTKWWDVLVSPILDATGGVVSLLAVSRDVTDFKLAQDQLNAAIAEAEADAQARHRFLVHAGAEIRAAVANILGFAGLLGRARTFEPEDRDHLQRISRVGAGLLSLLNDLLDLSRGAEKQPAPATSSMDVDRFMAAVVDLSAARTAAKWVAPPDSPVAARQVLFELDEQTRRILRLFKGAV